MVGPAVETKGDIQEIIKEEKGSVSA